MAGSKVSRKAANYAVELAKRTGASLTLLGVSDNRFIVSQAVTATASPTHLKEAVKDYLKQSVQASLDEIEKICNRKRIRCKAVMRSGHPDEEIVKEATRSRASLIVMGSLGKSALGAAVLGSVAYSVFHRNSNIPVLIVKR